MDLLKILLERFSPYGPRMEPAERAAIEKSKMPAIVQPAAVTDDVTDPPLVGSSVSRVFARGNHLMIWMKSD